VFVVYPTLGQEHGQVKGLETFSLGQGKRRLCFKKCNIYQDQMFPRWGMITSIPLLHKNNPQKIHLRARGSNLPQAGP
jgi:hypothetical protein